jgi:hypothetical protein
MLPNIVLTYCILLFQACQTVQEEWKIIKKAYFRAALDSHPDKGGEAATFRVVDTSFKVLRELLDAG